MLKLHFRHPAAPDADGARSEAERSALATNAAAAIDRAAAASAGQYPDRPAGSGAEPARTEAAGEPAAAPQPTTNPESDEGTGAVPQGIRLEARNLTATIGRGRVILHDVSLIAEPSELVAIVGVSGAGKTTLLGALSGVRP